jgi:hypothetical protein
VRFLAPTLKELDLSGPGMTDEVSADLVNALRAAHPPSLYRLHLGCDNKDYVSTARALSELMRENDTIADLSLNFEEPAAAAPSSLVGLVTALRHNHRSALTSLEVEEAADCPRDGSTDAADRPAALSKALHVVGLRVRLRTSILCAPPVRSASSLSRPVSDALLCFAGRIVRGSERGNAQRAIRSVLLFR